MPGFKRGKKRRVKMKSERNFGLPDNREDFIFNFEKYSCRTRKIKALRIFVSSRGISRSQPSHHALQDAAYNRVTPYILRKYTFSTAIRMTTDRNCSHRFFTPACASDTP